MDRNIDQKKEIDLQKRGCHLSDQSGRTSQNAIKEDEALPKLSEKGANRN